MLSFEKFNALLESAPSLSAVWEPATQIDNFEKDAFRIILNVIDLSCDIDFYKMRNIYNFEKPIPGIGQHHKIENHLRKLFKSRNLSCMFYNINKDLTITFIGTKLEILDIVFYFGMDEYMIDRTPIVGSWNTFLPRHGYDLRKEFLLKESVNKKEFRKSKVIYLRLDDLLCDRKFEKTNIRNKIDKFETEGPYHKLSELRGDKYEIKGEMEKYLHETSWYKKFKDHTRISLGKEDREITLIVGIWGSYDDLLEVIHYYGIDRTERILSAIDL